jgi:hypothetical protein
MVVGALIALGCDSSKTINNYYIVQPSSDAGEVDVGHVDAGETRETMDAGDPSDTSGPVVPSDAGSTEPDGGIDAGDDLTVAPTELKLDLFGTFNNQFEFVVSDKQLEILNRKYPEGPIWLFGNEYGDIYEPGGGAEGSKTYVDRLIVTNTDGERADFGKTEVRLVGQSTGRPWSKTTLPNLRVDTDEFTKGHKFGGYENVRFNNGVVSTIFREKYTLDMYHELGYPAPRASYAWVKTSVWGEQISVPYGVVEVYKPDFCKKRADYFGGGCPNMWEFVGDFGRHDWFDFNDPELCQFKECDGTRMNELAEITRSLAPGPGYKAALADYLDWDAFHEFQCLSWIFATGDDAFHNDNNVVIVERADGKFQYLPYSVDISFGQQWYQAVELTGSNATARGCQGDPECWADTVATCERLLEAFVALDPVQRLDTLYNDLDAAGMLRRGDDEHYRFMRDYIQDRLEAMPDELEAVRDNPYSEPCREGQVRCGDYCAYPWDCYVCGGDDDGVINPPRPVVVPPQQAPDAIVIVPPPAGSEDVPPPPPTDGGVEPVPCLPRIQLYRAE